MKSNSRRKTSVTAKGRKPRSGQWISIFIILAVLIVLLSILLEMRQHEIGRVEGLSIIDEEEMYQPTALDLNNIPNTIIRMNDGTELEGYLLTDILAYYEIDRDSIESIYLSSLDGSRIIVSYDEIREEDVMLMVVEGLHRTYRLAFPQDPFRNRWLKDIVLIEVN